MCETAVPCVPTRQGCVLGEGYSHPAPQAPPCWVRSQKLLALERAPGARFGCYGFVVSDASSSALAMFMY